MRLSLWILEADPLQGDQLNKRWKQFSPSFIIRTFRRSTSLLEAAAKEGLPDIVAGEWHPGSDKGTEFMQHLRSLGTVDLLPVTEDSSLLGFSRAMQLGCTDYLLKPFSNDRLRVSIERYCSRKQELPVHRPLTQQDLDRALTFLPKTRTAGSPAASSARSSTGSAGSLRLTDFRKIRLSAILRLLQSSPRGMSLSEITAALTADKKTTISRSMILSDLNLLCEHHLVKGHPQLTGLPGRPPLIYSLTPKKN